MGEKDSNSGCLSVIFPFFKSAHEDEIPKALPYRLRDDFLSPAEFSIYKILSSLIGSKLILIPKVRLADVFFVAHPNENYKYFSKISQKHLDFLACDAITMKPVFGVELDDSSHKRNDRQKRDAFLESVCEVAGFPLLRLSAQREYSSRELATQLAPFIDREDIESPLSQPEDDETENEVPSCPKCGIPMVLRTATQGIRKGSKFYGCKNYPRCRETKSISE